MEIANAEIVAESDSCRRQTFRVKTPRAFRTKKTILIHVCFRTLGISSIVTTMKRADARLLKEPAGSETLWMERLSARGMRTALEGGTISLAEPAKPQALYTPSTAPRLLSCRKICEANAAEVEGAAATAFAEKQRIQIVFRIACKTGTTCKLPCKMTIEGFHKNLEIVTRFEGS